MKTEKGKGCRAVVFGFSFLVEGRMKSVPNLLMHGFFRQMLPDTPLPPSKGGPSCRQSVVG
jgi:hypothetical protein